MTSVSQSVRLMGTLDEQYLAPKAFGTMHNFATLRVRGGEFFTAEGDLNMDWVRAHVGRVARDLALLRERPVQTPLRITTPVWLEVDELSLEHHVRVYPQLPSDRLALARACTGEGLPPLSPSRPLWDVHCGQIGRHDAVLILRMQHAMGDGYVVARLAHALMTPTPAETLNDAPSAAPSGALVLYRAASQWLAEFPLPKKAWQEYWRKPFRRRIRRWLRRLRHPIGRVDSASPSHILFPDRATFDLPHAKSLAKNLDGSLNALVVAATLLAAGEAHPDLPEVSLLVPYSRRRPTEARNHVSAVTVTWRRGETLAQTVSSVTRAINSAFRSESVPTSTPMGYATYLMFSRRPIRMGSVDLTEAIGWPTVNAPASIGCLASGYADHLAIALRTSSQEVTEVMMGCLRSIFSTPSMSDRNAGSRTALGTASTPEAKEGVSHDAKA